FLGPSNCPVWSQSAGSSASFPALGGVKLTLAAPTRNGAARCGRLALAAVGAATATSASAAVASEAFTALLLLTLEKLAPIASACTGRLGSRGVTAEPRPAASLILLRRGGKHRDTGVEVLLVRRSPEARFMPGVWVFPGGGVDADDGADEEEAHRAAAVRELHEEAGIELGAEAEL